EVDYTSSKKALIPSQKYSPFELGMGRMVHFEKENFTGRCSLLNEQRQSQSDFRRLIGLEVDWPSVEKLYDEMGLASQAPSIASRVHVPLYSGKQQAGKATSTTWSPLLKKMIALGSVRSEYASEGAMLEMEITIEATRRSVPAKVVKLPFYNPPRKTATPV
ncbi:MAG TPA: glycine cleavage T C-terminal barrel domain-containing protein, partial [Terriglobales bacterium]|nr:glycine cleavage T C-terminal barrel domain-containing protein [Terriglobales bacterium]